jgi:hypothetical protein
MAKLDEYQLAEKDMVDAIRTVVRLKHRIQQRHELNEIEDEWVQKLRDAAVTGQAVELPLPELLEGAFDEGSA